MKQTNNNTKYISDKTPISDCTKNVISVDVYFTTQGQVHSARKMHSPIQHSISQFNNCLVIMQIFIGCKVYNWYDLTDITRKTKLTPYRATLISALLIGAETQIRQLVNCEPIST